MSRLLSIRSRAWMNGAAVGRRFMAGAIQKGEKFPSNASVMTGDMSEKQAGDLLKGRKVAIVGIPGAFTPTCQSNHVPGFVQNIDKFAAKGVDVACFSVNDPFTLKAFLKTYKADDKIEVMADGDGSLTKQLGLEFDMGKMGGVRARRFSMLVDDGVVKAINIEEGGKLTDASTAEKLLEQID
mmetsp:Transcript_10218/g.31205  ORF Transcript_10218/g.31205 Transcript_10218/m.31205 type:complete len:183 (-) Transcript_10218:96-644(-)